MLTRHGRQGLETNRRLPCLERREGPSPEPAGARAPDLFFFLFHYYRLKVFGFKNLATIETFNVIHAIAAGDDLGAGVVTGGFHTTL